MSTDFLDRHWIRWLQPAVPFALLVWLWYSVTARQIFPPELLVPPLRVAQSFWELLQTDELRMHLTISLQRLATGVSIGAAAGLVFGVLMAVFATFESYTRPLFNLMRHVPAVALIPVFILMFGIGETFKVLIIVKAAFFPIALAAYQGVKNLPAQYLDVARVYRLPRLTLFRRVLLPSALPELVTGIRLALGRSWGTLVVAELLAAESGIGQMIQFAREMFRMDVVMVGVVIIGLVGFTLDRTIKLAERRVMHWRPA